jgi:hypothetical protein
MPQGVEAQRRPGFLKPETKRLAVRWAAGVHLFIALVYSSHLHVEHFIPAFLERPLRLYGDYSGAHTHFNFFAPAVVSQVRVHFRLGAPDGTVRDFEFTSSSSEVNQRLAAMFNFYLRPSVRPYLIEAWARYLLAAHPEAQWVQTRVEMLDIPPLAELASGRKAEWVEVGRFGAMREASPVR